MIVPCDECKGCYRPDFCYPVLQILKMVLYTVRLGNDQRASYFCREIVSQNCVSVRREFCDAGCTCTEANISVLSACSISAAPLSPMEGNGGMVAVVQGLQDAGLAVTLLSQRYPPSGRSVLAGIVGPTYPAQTCPAVVDSATEPIIKDRSNDSLYRSSYQLAHCQKSSLLPIRLPQYSLQRLQQFRSSTSRSSNEEAFVESLRKYPMSPVRSRSADLIERMLSYTQTKNGARYPNIRSAKSLSSKEASKYVHSDEIPTRDTGIVNNDSRPNFGHKRDVKLIPVPMNRKSRYDNQIEMYDYLKSNHKDKKLKGSEVRYLTNVKQCLRERLRQICDEDPGIICEKIQNRYSQHKRQYHRTEASQRSQKVNYGKNLEKCPECKESMAQDSSPNETLIPTSTTRECGECKVNKSLSSFKRSEACFSAGPGLCDCGTQLSHSVLEPKIPSEYLATDVKRKRCISICEYECNETQDLYIRQLRETVLNWLNELPVYTNFSTKHAKEREKIINNFIETLAQFQRDNTYFEKVEDEIKKCIKLLPVWRPQDKNNQKSFENELAHNLLQKIKSLMPETNEFKNEISKWINSISFTRDSIDKEKIVDELTDKLKSITLNRSAIDKNYKEVLKSEITSMLNDLPINFTGSRTLVINNIADKLVEKLHLIPLEQPSSPKQPDIKNIVLDWVKNVPRISDDINLNNDDYVLVNDLIARLSSVQNKDIDSKKKQMGDEVTNWLNFVEEKKKCRIDRNTKNMLTGQIVGKIMDLNQENQSENLNDIVRKWFNDILDALGVNIVDNQKDLDILATKLQDLQNIENAENRQNTMRQEIQKWLQNLQRTQGRYIDNRIQKNLLHLINKLMSMIKGEFDVLINISDNGLITQHVWEWLKSQPEFKQDNSLQYRDMVIEISQGLQDIIDRKGELTEYDLKAELTNWCQKLSEERGIKTDTNNQTKLQNKLLSLINSKKRRKSGEKSNNIEVLVSKEVSYIINDTVIPILDNTLKNKLKSKIEHILRMLPIKDKQQFIDTITDKVVKTYEDVKSDDFEVIFELLRKTNLSETEAEEVTNKILDMLNQFRNEVTNARNKTSSCGSAESLWTQKQMFMQRLEREITDFMEKVIDESGSFHKNAPTSERLFISKPLEDSINNYNKFKNDPLRTSTPTKSDSVRDINTESQYENQVKDIIKKWITNLKIDDIVDESFKRDMINDIARDIIDRQRYVQLSKIKRSSQDEMEHLKYQVFKWTSKLSKLSDLTAKTADIKMLLKSLEALGVPNLIPGEHKRQDKINYWSIIGHNGNNVTHDTVEHMEENIYNVISNRLNEILNVKHRNSEDRRLIDDVINELSKKLKNILDIDPNTQLRNVENLCKDELVSYLRKLNHYLDNSEEELENKASVLINDLKCLEFITNILKRNQEIIKENESKIRKGDAIKEAVQSWCQKLPIKEGKTIGDMKDIVDNLTEVVSRHLLITDMGNLNKNKFMDDILHNLKKFRLKFDEEDFKYLPEFTETLIETLKGVLNDSEKYYSTKEDSVGQKPTFKKAVEVMYDNIQNWCENLPLDLSITNEGPEQINMIIQNLAKKLLKKVGELNVDPEIFHDDYLYENVLKDEIENILDGLPKTKELEQVLATRKNKLIKDLLQAKEGMKNEIAVFEYKQQLKDEISKTFSSLALPILEETPFEVLKDNIADAFISLYYVVDDEELKKEFKNKILNEINKFCDDYLKRNPSTSLNARQLNQDLYKALKKVPVPNNESLCREVEQIRVKDIVTDWFKDLSLKDIPSDIQENKIISILAKRLLEIENEAELNPDIDVDEIMSNEISKWLKKVKFKSKNKLSTEPVTKNLIKKLKSTKDSRKFNESTIRKSINYADFTNDLKDNICCSPSNLSAKDRAHLQRIKDRNSKEQTILKTDDKKDVSVSPVPIATGMQTEDKRTPEDYTLQKNSQNASIQTIIREPEPPTSLTPQVIVKEYYWNPQGSPTMQQHSGSLLSCMQTSGPQPTGNIQQKNNITPQEVTHVTTASQTMTLPASKAAITQEASIRQLIKRRMQNNSIGTSTQSSCLTRASTTAPQLSNELKIESQTGHFNLDNDYLQLNVNRKAEIKSCQPCQERAVLCGEVGVNTQARTSKAFEQLEQDKEGIELYKNKPEFCSAGHINEYKNHLDDPNNLNRPCFRGPLYQTSTKDIECPIKRKRRNQHSCVCKNPMLTKCTIQSQSPYQRSTNCNKSCYVSKKHCPKCWDGFCPYPSYLYFRQD